MAGREADSGSLTKPRVRFKQSTLWGEARVEAVREERSAILQVLDADRDEDSINSDGHMDTQSPEGACGPAHCSENAVSSSLIL